jgi:hypothetical protein
MSGPLLRWTGTATALSSVAHGADVLGTVTYLRRERFLMPGGGVEDIPVVSGNAWRGLLRDTAADLWWAAAGEPALPVPVAHALWSGGALAKTAGTVLSGSRLSELRDVCPVVGVFGTAGGGRIIAGTLNVGKLVPVCAELEHVLPDELRTGDLPSIFDLTQIEYYSRFPGGARETSDDMETSSSGLARYGVETFAAGTRFATWCSLMWASAAEQSLFAETLDTFARNARVGGLARAGHGRLALNLLPPDGVATDYDWRAPLATIDKVRLREMLAWLD